MEEMRDRGAASKVLVLTVVEGGGKLGRVRFCIIGSHSAAEIQPFVEDRIKLGAIAVTDGLKFYSFLDGMGFQHETYVMSSPRMDDIESEAESNLKHVHLVISLQKRWLQGTYQGAVTPHHLHSCLDEFAFRFNRRTSTHRGKSYYLSHATDRVSETDRNMGFLHERRRTEENQMSLCQSINQLV